MNYFSKCAMAVFAMLFLVIAHAHGMLQNIKNTYNIVHDEYKHLSLVHGAIAWETGVIRRLYDLGPTYPTYGNDQHGRKVIIGYVNIDQTHKLVRLIHALFYRVPGSMAEIDFGVTDLLANNDTFIITQLIAEIIMQCEQVQQQWGVIGTSIDQIKDVVAKLKQEELEKLGKKTTIIGCQKKIENFRQKPWDNQAKIALTSLCKSLNNNLQKDLDSAQNIIENFSSTLALAAKNLKSLLKPEVFKKGENVELIIFEALEECNPSNENAIYPAHTVEMVLLAFVYKKCSHSRNALREFYDALNMQLDKKFLKPEFSTLDDEWIKDIFEPVTQAIAFENVENIFNNDENDLAQSLEDNFAEIIYYSMQIKGFPTPIGYEFALYNYQDDKTVRFVDCMCNTIRNFINIFAYDEMLNQFTIEKLKTTLDNCQPIKILEDFLTESGAVNSASAPEAHNKWLSVISNIPYVTYNKSVDIKTGEVTEVPLGKGYVSIPVDAQTDELKAFFDQDGNIYQLLAEDHYGCEMLPSLKNIIIVLDHLLQLHLFDNAGGLAIAFSSPHFIKEYWPSFCIKLGGMGYIANSEKASSSEITENFDELDYTSTRIYSTIIIGSTTCEFVTNNNHGYLTLIEADGAQDEAQLRSLFKEIDNFTRTPSLSLLVTEVLCRKKSRFTHIENNPQLLFLNFFAQPLENTNRIETDMTAIIAAMSYESSLFLDITKNLLLRVVELQPDEIQKQLMHIQVFQQIITECPQIDTNEFWENKIIKPAEQRAAEGILSKNHDIQALSLTLFRELFNKNHGFEVGEKVATEGILSDDDPIRRYSYHLFVELFTHGESFSTGTTAAIELVKSDYPSHQLIALKLFSALVDANESITPATAAAANGVLSDNDNIQSTSFKLFERLVSKRKSFGAAKIAAAAGLLSEKPIIREFSRNLFKALFAKKQGFTAAKNAIATAMKTDDLKTKLSALDLFKILIAKISQFDDFAEEVAAPGLLDQAPAIRYASLDIFAILFKQGEGFVAAIRSATEGLLSDYDDIQESSLRLIPLIKAAFPEKTIPEIRKLLENDRVSDEVKIKLRKILAQ